MKYHVSIPIKGTSTFEVEAVDEVAAICAAWTAVDEGQSGDVTWEYHEDSRTGDVPEAIPQKEEAGPKGRTEHG